MSEAKPPDRVLPDEPKFRPLERFWPYADLPEEPTEEELVRINPALREVLFGAAPLPFSISIVFPRFDGPEYAKAIERAKASDELVEFTQDGRAFHRARFFPGDRPIRLRELWEVVGLVEGVDVLIDDRPLPYARELWLPLVWFLIR